jgi:hypothetical protein
MPSPVVDVEMTSADLASGVVGREEDWSLS